MKQTLLALCSFITLLFGANSLHAVNIEKIAPTFWWAGMKNTELQILLYGKNIASSEVSLSGNQVILKEVVKQENPNYLLLYLDIAEAQAQTFQIVLKQGKKSTTIPYELKERERKGCDIQGFTASDVLYLIMPDRFANGNPDNDIVKGMREDKVDRNEQYARHGGDLKGIADHLDYIADLGVTAIWLNPTQENDMKEGSYHGYAITDYYQIDRRLGGNEDFKKLTEKAHEKGLKVVMDMIFNHCGVEHVWIKDMPSKDWFNNPDHENNFVQTSFKLTPHVDPYTSQYDADQMNDGWFVPSMPDLNQKNPHVYRYLVQNSFWWIEFANIDGIRMDTYPYADYDAMSNWMKELNEEYPNYNTVGETWVTEPAYTAWWQKDSKLSAPKNSNLKTVMDFSFFDKINTAKNEQTETWFKGLDRIYNNFVYDFLYPNPASVLAFIENHDTDRFLGEGNNLPMLKQASTLLLTTRRIPQLYYGTEVMMNGVKSKSDGYVRKDFPGGWTGDATNALTPAGRTKIQNECYDFYKTILNWRKGNDVIAKGSMVQFMVQNGVYAYARQYEGKTIFVMLNGTDAETTVPLKFYKEILKDSKQGKDILSGKAITFGEELKMGPRESLVIEL